MAPPRYRALRFVNPDFDPAPGGVGGLSISSTGGVAMVSGDDSVRQAIHRWEPRIDVLDVDAGAHPDFPDQLVIRLDYRVRASGATAALAYLLDLTGSS